jgi:hypothetical protein
MGVGANNGQSGGVSTAGSGGLARANSGMPAAGQRRAEGSAPGAIASGFTAPGWVRDELGVLRREKQPHMGRRLPGFDYSQRMIYEITLVLKERQPVLGRLVKRPCGSAAIRENAPDEDGWAVEPSPMGLAALNCWQKIPSFWPQVTLVEKQLMPDHFHGILFVRERLPLTYPDRPEGQDNRRKVLGDIVRGFKVGCTIAWRELAGNRSESAGSPPAAAAADIPQWAEGFVDTILFHKGQLAKMVAYLHDNPRRLGVKREHPDLFKVSRDIEIKFAPQLGNGGGGIAPWMGAASGHFNAIGNHFLLSRPRLVQVQCSRSFFRYRREFAAGPDDRRLAAGQGGREWAAGRSGNSRICRDANGVPIVEFSTPEFEAKLVDALSAAKHGAVLVSPCISHGEREIARQAFAAGYRVITFQNKGFSPLYKPGGKLFETCAAGNLLMLAPIKWPYQPAEKQMTRDDAQILNRIAQLVAGDGAVTIDYKGAVMSGIDERVSTAIAAPKQPGTAD